MELKLVWGVHRIRGLAFQAPITEVGEPSITECLPPAERKW